MAVIVPMIIGALITWFAAWYFYQKAGKELQNEAAELRKLNILMLRALENAGLAKFNRDENGNIKGMILEVEVLEKIKCSSKTSDANIETT